MFVWKASTILRYFRELLPDIYACLEKIGDAMGTDREQEVIREVYPVIPKISVDYGIMERARGVLMLEGDFGWRDVGSFDSLDSVRTKDEAGNIASGEARFLDAQNCVVCGAPKLIAAAGGGGVVLAEGGHPGRGCPVSQAQRIKQVVERLEEEGRSRFL